MRSGKLHLYRQLAAQMTELGTATVAAANLSVFVCAAAEAGANAVKFQTFSPESLATPYTPKALYQHRDGGSTESQRSMLQRLCLPLDAYESIISECTAKHIAFMSSPFGIEEARFLGKLGMPAFKISSGEITNYPLLSYVILYQAQILNSV